ncbi:YitT family protein [Aquibacillus koreensis]|uniref:YitT family protein n=1 Tax=Aquibacillus koreensis TaxID=279446 RepID=A0A9X3WKZ2_9BACI|nr:YitT family protein [Aquibacillus koreensis]MCT2537278.1 YitT family protein [Aquibacillus koreensis]MDC3421625.1 YitT family protein [Aquibacillus koreensis]
MIAKYRREPMPRALVNTIEYVLVVIGSFFVAVAFNVFLLPNEVASGGVAGISTITKAVFGWEPSIVQWAMNIPLFIAGVIILGKKFGAKSLVGTIILPLFVFLTREWNPATPDPLLAAIFGGMIAGLGIGIVFRGKASTGGIDLAAQILHKFFPLPLGICVALFDGVIVLTATFVFSIEQGLYALIGLFVTSRTIDFVQVGLNTSKNVMIITDQVEEVRRALLEDVDRGVTVLNGTGGYTDEARKIIMCVCAQNEFSKVTQIVRRVDDRAFVVAMNATEVLGEGFKTT